MSIFKKNQNEEVEVELDENGEPIVEKKKLPKWAKIGLGVLGGAGLFLLGRASGRSCACSEDDDYDEDDYESCDDAPSEE